MRWQLVLAQHYHDLRVDAFEEWGRVVTRTKALARKNMNELYPDIEPYNNILLPVDTRHQLYIEECGNPHGQPVLFVHGGPGAGCSSKDRLFFDPTQYRIVLFDQRGCGRSLPHGCLEDNDTQR